MQFHRKNIRLPAENYRGIRAYFITLCCDHRRKVFSAGRVARWIIDQIGKNAAHNFFRVHAYCVMPDHVHFLAEGTEPTSDLLEFVGQLKHRTGLAWNKRFGAHLWQHKFYDHILRAKDNPDHVAWYIWMNPVRAGLCSQPQQYPFSGSFTIAWKHVSSPTSDWMPPWRKEAEDAGSFGPGAT